MGWSGEGIESTAHAVATARALAAESISEIYASPVVRAVQTAQPLAELCGVSLVTDDRFGELHVGPWEGLTEAEIADRYPQEWAIWRSEPERLVMDGRESLSQLWARIAEGMADIAACSGMAVVFTHDAVVRGAVGWALGCPVSLYRHIEVENCSVTTVRVVDGHRSLVRLNDVCHLDCLDD